MTRRSQRQAGHRQTDTPTKKKAQRQTETDTEQNSLRKRIVETETGARAGMRERPCVAVSNLFTAKNSAII